MPRWFYDPSENMSYGKPGDLIGVVVLVALWAGLAVLGVAWMAGVV